MGQLLENKVALVTGASRGIGKAIALRLAQDGAFVVVHYGRNADAANTVVQEIKANGGAAFSVQAELGTLANVYALYEALDAGLNQQTGTNQFDILVNNAGIAPKVTIEETTEAIFDELIAVNVKAPFFLIQQALPRLRDGGRIINLSSAVTRIAFSNVTAYSLTKGAINTLTLVLAKQLGARNITVNSLAPGIIDTDINADILADEASQKFAASLSALGRVGQPSDVADAAAFLASSDSRWVTGQYLDVSGGSHL
ncbi:SDR family oxidoreductase [Nostoc sp. WHI]|uniref:SDR family oxidoreductase n=1 Tax=Nostoc sp. WHI TaxID=2650611 RepID=UPI0018C80C8F|nr:SDR family oxidoreductase [Nostoc sp. WHI]